MSFLTVIWNWFEMEKRHREQIMHCKSGIAKLREWEKGQELIRASQVAGTVGELQDTVKGVYPEAKEG